MALNFNVTFDLAVTFILEPRSQNINRNTHVYQTQLSTKFEVHLPSCLEGVVHQTDKQTDRAAYAINNID